MKFDGLLSMGVLTQAQQIIELVKWKLDPILHLQTELWPVPQSSSLSHMEKVVGKDLRCVVCLYYYCITLLHYNDMLFCFPFLTGCGNSSSVIWGSSCIEACILALDCYVAKLLPLIFYYFLFTDDHVAGSPGVVALLWAMYRACLFLPPGVLCTVSNPHK